MSDADKTSQGDPQTEDQARRWAEMLRHARSRPAMYIGGTDTAHRSLISIALRLVWQAKVFRRPQRVRVDLSPHQCAVRCETWPLIRPVQGMFSFPGGRVLGDVWREESRRYLAVLEAEDDAQSLSFGQHRCRRGWRYCFSGPTGPRLAEPSYASPLARRLTWGLRTNDGLWCQGYDDGWPVGTPFLIDGPSSVGLFVLADLDPRWFTGLPYDAEDVEQLRAAAHRPQGRDERWKPEPAWTAGEIVLNWHEQDDLVSERSLTAEGVREWL